MVAIFMKKGRLWRHGSRQPAFTPLSAGSRDLNFRRYGVVPSGTLSTPWIFGVEPFGSYRLHSKPRTCRRPGLQACPRPIGPSGEGRAPGRVRLAPLDYRTRPIWRPLPEVARRSRPTPMPTARGPHSKETARSLTCELSWPSTMLVRVPSGRQPIIDLSRYSSILMGGGIGVGRLARQVRGE